MSVEANERRFIHELIAILCSTAISDKVDRMPFISDLVFSQYRIDHNNKLPFSISFLNETGKVVEVIFTVNCDKLEYEKGYRYCEQANDISGLIQETIHNYSDTDRDIVINLHNPPGF